MTPVSSDIRGGDSGVDGTTADAAHDAVDGASAESDVADVSSPLDEGTADAYDADAFDGTGGDGTGVDVGADADASHDAVSDVTLDADATDSPVDQDAAPPADANDAAVPEAGEAGDPTEAVIVEWVSAECVPCANDCLARFGSCETLSGQVSDGGSAPGESRDALCLDTLQCGLKTACFEEGSDVVACICGSENIADCETNGPLRDDAGDECSQEEQAGLETADPTTEFAREFAPAFGGGLANQLINCIKMCDLCP
jgi:hypothetical protein